uniref:Uncharacterized protein n=1 Tax=uncultured Armatimonadetes bacterium TaxID=157466 RepID=A0A6J4HRD6_9BACT|nr:hypothetical protein AVDCRST_MAG63-1118 [uncultured Armatimonadetes bacterium]
MTPSHLRSSTGRSVPTRSVSYALGSICISAVLLWQPAHRESLDPGAFVLREWPVPIGLMGGVSGCIAAVAFFARSVRARPAPLSPPAAFRPVSTFPVERKES